MPHMQVGTCGHLTVWLGEDGRFLLLEVVFPAAFASPLLLLLSLSLLLPLPPLLLLLLLPPLLLLPLLLSESLLLLLLLLLLLDGERVLRRLLGLALLDFFDALSCFLPSLSLSRRLVGAFFGSTTTTGLAFGSFFFGGDGDLFQTPRGGLASARSLRRCSTQDSSLGAPFPLPPPPPPHC